jgi:uncharacterized SAM-binding protein YcdF (DUF218 family)
MFPSFHILVLVARGLAAALGLFAVTNSLLAQLAPGAFLDQNIWWVDCRPAPSWLANPILAASGVLLASYAWKREMATWRRRLTVAALLLLLAASVWNTVAFYGLLALEGISTSMPVPLSAAVAGVLAFLLWAVLNKPDKAPASRPTRLLQGAIVLSAAATMALAFPLAQMFTFGLTDYRRPADAAVVLGAAVWPGNVPSHALADRVNTGIVLYHQGTIQKLIFSGGPSATPERMHEVDVMHRMALDAGVPDHAIILDRNGINTAGTAEHCTRIARQHELRTILAVSHFYHLPRIKMAFQRRGLNVYTVPAHETQVLLKLPYYLAREVAALWFYYLGGG